MLMGFRAAWETLHQPAAPAYSILPDGEGVVLGTQKRPLGNKQIQLLSQLRRDHLPHVGGGGTVRLIHDVQVVLGKGRSGRPRSLAGNPDSPQAGVFVTSNIDEIVSVATYDLHHHAI